MKAAGCVGGVRGIPGPKGGTWGTPLDNAFDLIEGYPAFVLIEEHPGGAREIVREMRVKDQKPHQRR